MNKSKKEVVLILKLSGESKYFKKVYARTILVPLMIAMPNLQIRLLAGDVLKDGSSGE